MSFQGIRSVEEGSPSPRWGPLLASKLPELMSVADLAKATSVSTKTVYRWLKSGQVTGVRVGPRQIRVSVSSAMHLLRPEAEGWGAKELAMSNNEPEVQLGPQVRYSKEYTGEVDGLVVPLGTKNAMEARARLVSARQRWTLLCSQSTEEMSVNVVTQKGVPRFIKYKPSPNAQWQTKRIPAEHVPRLSDGSLAEAYALRWAVAVGLEPRGDDARKEDISRLTLDGLSSMWSSGRLAARYGTHVRVKKSAKADESRYNKYIKPVVGTRLIASLSGARAATCADEIVEYMASLSPGLSTASRRHILQVYNRLLNLAVFPLRVLERNDLPAGYLPKVQQLKAAAYLYPDEEAQLLASKKVPMHYRMFFGLQAREGARASELLSLASKDVDLERGIVKLDQNKTGRPRAWKLTDGTVKALKRWQNLLGPRALATGLLLVDPKTGKKVPAGKGARQLRAALQKAKVSREELFERSDTRMAIRAHDLRATFVTIALANGRSEAWVTDRTGHTTSAMLYRYKRAARTHEEAELGDLVPLWKAIPELQGEPEE